jgi:hypothetical protein
MGEPDDYVDDDQPRDQDSPLLMPSIVVGVLVAGSLVGLAVIALYARVFGVPQ